MGKLIIHHNGEVLEYLINTSLKDEIVDKIVNDILKHFPSDAYIDFIELF